MFKSVQKKGLDFLKLSVVQEAAKRFVAFVDEARKDMVRQANSRGSTSILSRGEKECVTSTNIAQTCVLYVYTDLC